MLFFLSVQFILLLFGLENISLDQSVWSVNNLVFVFFSFFCCSNQYQFISSSLPLHGTVLLVNEQREKKKNKEINSHSTPEKNPPHTYYTYLVCRRTNTTTTNYKQNKFCTHRSCKIFIQPSTTFDFNRLREKKICGQFGINLELSLLLGSIRYSTQIQVKSSAHRRTTVCLFVFFCEKIKKRPVLIDSSERAKNIEKTTHKKIAMKIPMEMLN